MESQLTYWHNKPCTEEETIDPIVEPVIQGD